MADNTNTEAIVALAVRTVLAETDEDHLAAHDVLAEALEGGGVNRLRDVALALAQLAARSIGDPAEVERLALRAVDRLAEAYEGGDAA